MHKWSRAAGRSGSLPFLLVGSLALAGCGARARGDAARSAPHSHQRASDAALADWNAKPAKLAAGAVDAQAERLAKDPDPSLGADPGEPEAARRGKRRPTGTPEPAHGLASGERCLAELTAKKVRFKSLEERPGIETPVRIDGPIGGVTYFAHGLQLIVDCRMGLALVRIAPLLARHDITRVRFSGAYVYRLTRHGKLSLHANGLALDVHQVFTKDGTSYEVERDFARGVGCAKDVPFVNRLACELRETELFRELITPDYDADHKDHLHLGIPRLATTPTTLAVSPAGATKGAAGPRKNVPPAASTPAPVAVTAPTAPPGSLPEALPEAPVPDDQR